MWAPLRGGFQMQPRLALRGHSTLLWSQLLVLTASELGLQALRVSCGGFHSLCYINNGFLGVLG